MKKLFATVALMCVSALLLTGCGGNKYYGLSVDPEDYVILGEYTGMEVEVFVSDITDEIIDETLNYELASYQEGVPVEGRTMAEDGDYVDINFAGKVDGEYFEGETGEHYKIQLGSNRTIEGFESGIVGHEIGESFVLNLQFPDDYQSTELAGKPVEFEITLNEILEMQLPELTDEFVQSLGFGYNTAQEMRDSLRTMMEEDNEKTKMLAVWDKVVQGCTVGQIPTDLYDACYQVLIDEVNYYASSYGMDVQSYVSAMGYEYSDFEAQTKTQAEELAKERLIAYALAKQENIEVTDEEMNEYADSVAATYGYTTGEEFLEAMGKGDIETYLLLDKVQLYLLENNAIINTKEAE